MYDVNREKVMLVLVKAMKNPRSALCKTSIMASSDIFKAFGDKLLDSFPSDAFDPLVRTHFFSFFFILSVPLISEDIMWNMMVL